MILLSTFRNVEEVGGKGTEDLVSIEKGLISQRLRNTGHVVGYSIFQDSINLL